MSLESFEQPVDEIYKELKSGLLSGAINFKDFQVRLTELDQSTVGREHALRNADILYDTEIEEYVEKYPEHIGSYYRFLSFTEFHIGQIKAYSEKDDVEALIHFKKSLEHLHSSDYSREEDHDWEDYIEGTIAYLENDKRKLEMLHEKLSEKVNGKVLNRFIAGLQKRGGPSYKEDY